MKGLIFGAFVFVAAIVATMFVLSLGNRTAILTAERADCFVLPIGEDDTEITEIDVIPCDEPHDAQIVETGVLNEGDAPYPGADELLSLLDRRCPPRGAFPGFGIVPVAPNEASWSGQQGAYVCMAITVSGELVTTSLFDGAVDE